jgi:hypothetical protein
VTGAEEEMSGIRLLRFEEEAIGNVELTSELAVIRDELGSVPSSDLAD